MLPPTRLASAALLVGAWLLTGSAFGVSDKSKSPQLSTVKDRKDFIPYRKHQPLKGTVVGILVADGQPVLTVEGRFGPADQLLLGTGGGSYRWVYVPTQDAAIISNLQVPVAGGKVKVYPKLNMANLKTVKQWGITQPYTLVEVEVNDGLGSPAGDSFAATKMKVLEGTSAYPLKVADVITDLRKRYAAHLKHQDKAIEKAMAESQKKALKDQKPTGPREKAELMYVTWLPETKKLRVHFRTRISDGAYKFIRGGLRGRPLSLPARGGLRPPPPPRQINVRTGTMFGVEFGMAYEVSRAGTIERIEKLPFESFQQKINMPAGGPAGGPLNPLPPPPKR